MASSRRRALVAAFVGALGAVLGIAGAGHAYLRQWRRAVAWFSFVLGAGLVLLSTFADPASFADPADVTPATLPLTVTLPLVGLLVLSVADAYRVGGRRTGRRPRPVEGDATDEGMEPTADAASCPNCGRSLDPSMEFCWYCARRLPGADDAGGEGATSR